LSGEPKTVWCVSDGRAGIERQTLAVADALSEIIAINIKTIRLTPSAPQVWLPPTLWPAPLSALPPEQRAQLIPPWPDVWIANGRRSIPYSLKMREWSGGVSFVVQLQDPRVDARRFDMVVPPLHDQLVGKNVVPTLGAPVWYTDNQIIAAYPPRAHYKNIDQKRAIVILGGTSKRHQFTLSRAEAILADLNRIADSGIDLFITTSRRTPIEIETMFRTFAQIKGARFYANEKQDGPNFYLGWLSLAHYALVTEDSTNMITDAAFFGLPVHLLKLDGGDARFARLHKGFIDAGVARWFSGKLEKWTYEPVRDAMEVAKAIAARLP
jgi:uncharacterized protein